MTDLFNTAPLRRLTKGERPCSVCKVKAAVFFQGFAEARQGWCRDHAPAEFRPGAA